MGNSMAEVLTSDEMQPAEDSFSSNAFRKYGTVYSYDARSMVSAIILKFI